MIFFRASFFTHVEIAVSLKTKTDENQHQPS